MSLALPADTQRKLIDALMSGKTAYQAATIAKVSRPTAYVYKRKVEQANADAAKIMKANKIQAELDPDSESVSIALRSNLTQSDIARDLATTSLFRDRLEILWNHCDDGIELAKRSVKVVADKNGNLVPVGRDVAALAPLLGQAHRNVELLGQATGALQNVAHTQVMIVCPAQNQQVTANTSSNTEGAVTIDIKAAK